MMIIKLVQRINGKKFMKVFSDQEGKQIMEIETGIIYDEAMFPIEEADMRNFKEVE